MKRLWFIAALVVCAACTPEADPPPSTVVASVGTERITLGDFAEGVRLLYRERQAEKLPPIDPSTYPELLERMIDLELLSKEAERRSIATLPIARRRMREAMVDVYLDDALRRLTVGREISKKARHKILQDGVRLLLERLRSDPTLDDPRFATFGAALADEGKELIAREAERLGFHRRFATTVARKQILASLLLRSEAETGRLRPEPVTETDARNAYDAAPERFRRAARMHVWVARVGSAASAAALAHELASIGVSDTAAHSDLLADYRTGPGLVIDLEDDDERVPTAVRRALDETERDGDVLGPLAADGDFFVARRLARTAAVEVPFEKAKDELTSELKRRAWTEASHNRARAFEARWPVEKNIDALEGFATMQRRTIREI